MEQARRIKRGWMNLRVEKIIDETWDTKTFVLVDADEGGRPFDYIAAQYLTFRFDHIGEKPLVRSYTMSSSPCERDYSAFTVKAVPGGVVSNWLLQQVKPGDILRARGPIGKFAIDPLSCQHPLFMVAGGSGVTPFVSILREYADAWAKTGQVRRAALLVAYRSQNDLICWDTLQKVKDIPGLKVVCSLTREQAQDKGFWYGRPDVRMLEEFFEGHYAEGIFMTCGPDELMTEMVTHLKSKGVDEQRILQESFAS